MDTLQTFIKYLEFQILAQEGGASMDKVREILLWAILGFIAITVFTMSVAGALKLLEIL